jgi:hypothetical protein
MHDDRRPAALSAESRPTGETPRPDARAIEEHFRTVRHIRARKGAAVRFREDGLVLIVEPCGGLIGVTDVKGHAFGCGHDHDGDSIHWYCAESQGTCVGGTATTCPYAPYAVSTPSPAGFPNPNTKSPIYPGPRARYWPTPTVTFYINCPQGEANIAPQSGFEDVFPISQFGPGTSGYVPGYHPLNNCGGTAAPNYYTYTEFIWDVCYTMAKYGAIAETAAHPALPTTNYVISGGIYPLLPHRCTPSSLPQTLGSPYASIVPVFGGISGPPIPPYPQGTTPPPANVVDIQTRYYGPYSANCAFDNPIPVLGGKQIWEYSHAVGTNGFACPGVGGPTGDEINEIIWIDSTTNAQYDGLTSCLVDPATGQIQECDVLFFKRPSNTAGWPHNGCAGSTATTAGCPNGIGPGATTAYGHEIGHFFGLDHTNLHAGRGLSANPPIGNNDPRLGFIAQNAGPSNSAPATLATFAGNIGSTLSAPWSAMPDMVGAISATDEWRCSPNRPVHPDEQGAVAELYGTSGVVAVTTPSNLTFERRPIINDHARWEGVVRILVEPDSDPIFSTNAFGINVFPLIDGQSPQTYPCVGKVAGTAAPSSSDIVGRRDTGTSAPSSARFQMEGVVVGSGGAGLRLCAEPLQSLFPAGFGQLVGASGTANFAEWWSYPNYGTNGQNRVWYMAGDFPTQRFLSSRFAHPTSLGTLYAFPGTILEVDIGLPSPAVPAASGPETVTRPTILMTPRDATLCNPNPVLTAVVFHDYELDFSSARFESPNGVIVNTNILVSTNQPSSPIPPGSVGPWVTTFQMTVDHALYGVGDKIIRFICMELPFTTAAPTFRPPSGITPVRGVNEVRF